MDGNGGNTQGPRKMSEIYIYKKGGAIRKAELCRVVEDPIGD